MSETITYPLADWLDSDEAARCGDSTAYDRDIRAVATEEFRPPRAGERYLSGASVAAYRAPNDLSTAYRIARLVRVAAKTVTVETIIRGY